MRGAALNAAELRKSRCLTRSELAERLLTETSRRRALTDEESEQLEAAIVEQSNPRLDRIGRRRPFRYFGRIAAAPSNETRAPAEADARASSTPLPEGDARFPDTPAGIGD